ncbi:unnamed protein product [Arabidopsis arenosa]|uniref:Glycine-rich protein n=1 Tax=Arabidopsis arenosa TaxID=38785 RepID=A0A8S1ZN14_ARAAE|nr:unnamed protein product [Arabidopsis arenosa]
MLDKLTRGIGGFGRGYGHYRRSGGYGFEEHKEFVTHVESEGGYFDRQARYDHRMRLPANHGRPPMAHMPVYDEEDSDSDVEEFFESSRSHYTTATLPHHSSNQHQQPLHLNYRPPLPATTNNNYQTQLHHNGTMGKIGNGWQGQHEDAYHGGHGTQHHDMHGMQHQGGHGIQDYNGQWMKQQDMLMAPQVPPRHVYMNPNHRSGYSHAVVVKATENWQVSKSSGRRKLGWGSKGL